jgi:aromatic-L-amino-acid/L-tryptophan decarboxylase
VYRFFPCFEVMAPWKFSLICFRLRERLEGDEEDAVNNVDRELLATVNASGQAFMTHFMVDGKFVIRLAVGDAATEMRHVWDVWELLQRVANDILQGHES